MTDETAVIPSEPAGEPVTTPSAASQQPAGGGADAPEGQEQQSGAEALAKLQAQFDEAVGTRQAAKERARKAEAELTAAREQLKTLPSADDLAAFRAWQKDKSAQARDKALKDGDVEAIERGIREPLEAKNAAQGQQITRLQGQLTTVLRDQALLKAAAAHNAIDPESVVMLVRDRVRMDVTDEGQFVPVYLNAEGDPLYNGNGDRVVTAEEFLGSFLANPRFHYLVRSTVAPGSGAKPAGGNVAPPDKVTTMADLSKLSPAERETALGSMTPEEVRALMPQAGNAVDSGSFI